MLKLQIKIIKLIYYFIKSVPNKYEIFRNLPQYNSIITLQNIIDLLIHIYEYIYFYQYSTWYCSVHVENRTYSKT